MSQLHSAATWQRAHDELLRLARTHAGLDFEEGQWLLFAHRSRVHERLGFGSFSEYVGRLFGYGARLVQEKLRVAEALERLSVLAEALKQGRVCWSALRELTRVATPETEAAWLAAATGRTVRELEKLVSGLAPGSRPGDLADPKDVRHVLRFEVTGDVLACVREALMKLRRDAGEQLDDEAALLLMARAVLEGPRDEGRASYQIALTVCEHCQRGKQDGAGEPTPVGPEAVEMAGCDAQHVGPIAAAVGGREHVGASAARGARRTAGGAPPRAPTRPWPLRSTGLQARDLGGRASRSGSRRGRPSRAPELDHGLRSASPGAAPGDSSRGRVAGEWAHISARGRQRLRSGAGAGGRGCDREGISGPSRFGFSRK